MRFVFGFLLVLVLAERASAADTIHQSAHGVRSAGRPPRIDPRLEATMIASPSDTVTVWVTFADKGERSTADHAARLRRAAAELSTRARARRLRAAVSPLVDDLDLPVEPRYLDALRSDGFAPYAVSRWFNRAAVRVPASRIRELVAHPHVTRIEPVEKARLSERYPGSTASPVPGGSDAQHGPASPPTAGTGSKASAREGLHAIDYGRSLAQLEQIGVPALHDSGYVGAGILICMLDSGYRSQATHEATRTIDIPPGMRRDFAEGDTVVSDFTSAPHGLWTLACAGANREGQLVGSAPGASFALARTEVENSENVVEMLYWALGAEWADSLGADVLSSSLGYSEFDDSLDSYAYRDMDGHTTTVSRAAEIAAAKGILVVSSVGNEGSNEWHYVTAPADVDGDSLIAVGAVTLTEFLAYFSSAGPTADGRIKPDLVACGVANPLPRDDDPTGTEYFDNSGTSLSAPLVAGLAACLLQARPQWTPRDLILRLRETANRYAQPNNGYGYGVPNGLAALRGTPGERPVPLRGLLGLAVDAPNPIPNGHFPISIRFALAVSAPEGSPAHLDVLDVTGRTVQRLWSGVLSPGQTVATTWDGRGPNGPVRAGFHWIVLAAGGRRSALRVVSL